MEPILDPNNFRGHLFPIKYQDIWDIRQKHKASFWTAEEVDLVSDLNDWNNKLNDDERYFIKMVIAFFAKSDFIVNENLAKNFSDRIQIPEFQFFTLFKCLWRQNTAFFTLNSSTHILKILKKKKVCLNPQKLFQLSRKNPIGHIPGLQMEHFNNVL